RRTADPGSTTRYRPPATHRRPETAPHTAASTGYAPAAAASPDHVPDTNDRFHHRRIPQPPPQPVDRHPHRVREPIGELIPHPLQPLLLADRATVGARQHIQRRVLLAGQRDLPPPAHPPPPHRIHHQIAPRQQRRVHPSPPPQRPHPQHQLRERERLAQVVVG